MRGHIHEVEESRGLDTRLKLAVLFAALFFIITSKGFFFPLFMLLVSAALSVYMRVPGRRMLARLAGPVFIVAVLFLIKSLSGKSPAFSFALAGMDLSFYKDGMAEGAELGLRIMAAVGAVSVVSFCTPFSEFMAGLGWYRFPKGLIEIALFGIRYVRGFFEEAERIYHSQKNRLGYSSLKRSLNSLGILAGSLTIKAFEQAEATSTAMVQRGYDGGRMRLHAARKRPGAMEFGMAFILIFLMAAAWKLG